MKIGPQNRISKASPPVSRPEPKKLADQVILSGGKLKAERWFRLPGQSEHTEIGAEKAADKLNDGKELLYKAPDSPTELPVRSQEDLLEAAVLQGGDYGGALPHPELAEDLMGLSKLGYRFDARHHSQEENVGVYGAYNALTGDLELSNLQVWQAGVATKLNDPTDASELFDFEQSDSNLLELRRNDYQFFDAKGRPVSAFNASRIPQASIGKGEPWLSAGTTVEAANHFESLVKELGSPPAARLAEPAVEEYHELLEYVSRGQNPKERVALARYALKEREEPSARLLLEAAQSLSTEKADRLFQRGLGATASLSKTLVAIAPELEARRWVTLATEPLKNSSGEAARLAYEIGGGDNGQYKLKSWDSIQKLFQAALDQPTNVETLESLLEPLYQKQQYQDYGRIAEGLMRHRNSETDRFAIEVAYQGGDEYRLQRWESLHALYSSALEDGATVESVSARAMAEAKKLNQVQDAALIAESGLKRLNNERGRFILETVKPSGDYALKQWESVMATYENALAQPHLPLPLLLDEILNDISDTQYQDRHMLVDKFLEKAKPESHRWCQEFAKSGETYLLKGWPAITNLYREALVNDHQDKYELARGAFRRVKAQSDQYHYQDAAYLAEQALDQDLQDPKVRDLADLVISTAGSRQRYSVKMWDSILGLYEAAFNHRGATGSGLAAPAREAVQKAVSAEDKATIGRKFIQPLRWNQATSEAAFWAGRVDQNLTQWESVGAVYDSLFRQPTATGVHGTLSLAQTALESVGNANDRETLAQVTLGLLIPRLDGELKSAAEAALRKPGQSQATLELIGLKMAEVAPQDQEVKIDEEGVQVGDSWIPIQSH